jgi:hypothetical protein
MILFEKDQIIIISNHHIIVKKNDEKLTARHNKGFCSRLKNNSARHRYSVFRTTVHNSAQDLTNEFINLTKIDPKYFDLSNLVNTGTFGSVKCIFRW